LGNVLFESKSNILNFQTKETGIYKIVFDTKKLSEKTSFSFKFSRPNQLTDAKINIGSTLEEFKASSKAKLILEEGNLGKKKVITFEGEKDAVYGVHLLVKKSGQTVESAKLSLFDAKKNMVAANYFTPKKSKKLSFYKNFIYKCSEDGKMTLEFDGSQNDNIAHIAVVKFN
jgi:hypothetical protein